ncbi:IclR family transcriptional regulator domain-containing protein [Streptomyces sp. NPDC054796]
MPQQESVRPLERGLAVLRAMSWPGKESARPGDLVRATGLARSTVDRVIATLDRLGHVRFDGQEAVLAPRLMELGNAYLSASGLPDALGAQAEALADHFDESVSLAVPDGDGVRFIVQATRRRTMALAFRIGDLLPAERCAPGALFASRWDADQWEAWRRRRAADPHDEGFSAVPARAVPGTEEEFVRRAEAAGEDGWSLDDQLIEPGLVAVAVPVRGPDGRTACALSAVSHTSRHSARDLARTVLPRLREAAATMESTLAARAGERNRAHGAGDADAAGSGGDPARSAKSELGAGFLQSLARGLTVLRALGEGPSGQGMSLSAVAEATGLARATARRSLLTLEELGYAECSDHLFRPLPRVLELGYAHLTGLSFADIAQPHLRGLVARVHESASVTVLDGTDILYVARVPTIRIMSISITLGTRFPAYATAMGRVLLAGLPETERAHVLERAEPRAFTEHTVTSVPRLARIVEATARSGYAAIDQELEVGLRSVAVPLRDAGGRVIAALNVAQHSGSEPLETTRDALLPALRATAAAVEADLRIAARHHRVRIP